MAGPRSRKLAAVLGGALLLLGCASPAAPRNADGESRGASSGTPPAPKTLRIGTSSSREPAALAEWGGSTPSSSSPLEHFHIFHANLTMLDAEGNTIVQAAQKIPSLGDGDWRVLPNGGMEVTWMLRPNIHWHDGTPLTAEDFVFGFQVIKDPELGVENRPEIPNIADVRATDDHTLVISWKTQSIRANTNAADFVPPIPRHLLRDLYLTGDKVAFTNSPLWSTEWIGLGPYRLSQWVRGSFVEGTAFDAYFLGRPKIDRIVIRYLGDANAMVANILAGEVDVITLGAQLDIGQVVAVREAWAAQGVKGLTLPVPKGVRGIYLQFRDPTAPWVQDLRVRQALLHALDREEFVQALQSGLTSVADYYVMPNDPVHRLAEERRVPRYPYDPARAERLFAEAGWARGADRVLRNGSGRGFSFDLTGSAQGDNVKELEALASQWSSAGLEARPVPYPVLGGHGGRRGAPRDSERWRDVALELRGPEFARRLIASEIGTPENKFRGGNYGGYTNPTYETLYTDLTNTLDPTKYLDTRFQMVKLMAEELPLLPVFYTPLGLIARPGLDGPGLVSPLQPSNTWNIHTWELRDR